MTTPRGRPWKKLTVPIKSSGTSKSSWKNRTKRRFIPSPLRIGAASFANPLEESFSRFSAGNGTTANTGSCFIRHRRDDFPHSLNRCVREGICPSIARRERSFPLVGGLQTRQDILGKNTHPSLQFFLPGIDILLPVYCPGAIVHEDHRRPLLSDANLHRGYFQTHFVSRFAGKKKLLRTDHRRSHVHKFLNLAFQELERSVIRNR